MLKRIALVAVLTAVLAITAALILQQHNQTAAVPLLPQSEYSSEYIINDGTSVTPPPETLRKFILYGLPRYDATRYGKLRLLINRAYLVGYSDKLNAPVWVAYRLSGEPIHDLKRPSRFKPDQRVPAPIKHDDYTHSGFDRGHLAPNFAIMSRFGKEAQMETFLLTNIIPQTPKLNRGVWKELEILIAGRENSYAEKFRGVWIVTGGIYPADLNTTHRLKDKVPEPTACYKIVLDIDDANSQLRALTFIFPNRADNLPDSTAALTSIDAIEASSAIDVLPALEDAIESEIESTVPQQLWPIVDMLQHIGASKQTSAVTSDRSHVTELFINLQLILDEHSKHYTEFGRGRYSDRLATSN